MKTQVLYTTFSCDLKGCKEEITTKENWLDFFDKIREFGWRHVCTSSPHPVEQGLFSWAISIYFCPEHSYLADLPDEYVIPKSSRHREGPSYVVKMK